MRFAFMEKALIICGSANKEGCTYTMCKASERILTSRGYQTELFLPGDMDIGHCRDCGGCDGGSCVLSDDMGSIYRAFSESDHLILSTPIHFSGPSSILKMVMDRFQPYWSGKDLGHPEDCFLMMCGGSEEPRYEYTEKIVRAFCLTIGMRFLGSYTISGTDGGFDCDEGEVASFLGVIEDMER
jgi:multimeric flavodoxin WrbA